MMNFYNFPKVCTWNTFWDRVMKNQLVDIHADNFEWGVPLQWKVEAQAKAEGWELYRWNPNGQRGNAVGTQVWTRKPLKFWVEFAVRAGLPIRAEMFEFTD